MLVVSMSGLECFDQYGGDPFFICGFISCTVHYNEHLIELADMRGPLIDLWMRLML